MSTDPKNPVLDLGTGEQKTRKKAKQKQRAARPKIDILKKEPLRFERVNESTWKVTDGTSTNVPASHGQWGGYRTAKAVAWLMDIGSGNWVARCKDMACHPLPLPQAKAAAREMVASKRHDYRVTDIGAPDLDNLTVQFFKPSSDVGVGR